MSNPIIDGYRVRADAVSAEIKTTESYLRDSGVRLIAAVVIDSRNTVSWTLYAAPSTWRVVWQGEYVERGGGDRKAESRPLIETPIAVRTLCAPHMQALVDAVAERLRQLDAITRSRVPDSTWLNVEASRIADLAYQGQDRVTIARDELVALVRTSIAAGLTKAVAVVQDEGFKAARVKMDVQTYVPQVERVLKDIERGRG